MKNKEFKKGRIVFDNGEVIDAATTERAFLGSDIGKCSVLFVKNREFCSYSTPVVGVFGSHCVVVVFFESGVLIRLNITICEMMDEIADGEKEVSFEKELKIDKIRQDAWLEHHLGPPPYHFSWGSVESVLDKRSFSCNVIIVYNHIEASFRY